MLDATKLRECLEFGPFLYVVRDAPFKCANRVQVPNGSTQVGKEAEMSDPREITALSFAFGMLMLSLGVGIPFATVMGCIKLARWAFE